MKLMFKTLATVFAATALTVGCGSKEEKKPETKEARRMVRRTSASYW